MANPSFTLRPASPEALALAGLWTSMLDIGVWLGAIACAIHLWAPPQDLPWKPFRLDAPMGMATTAQFRRAAADPALCREALEEGGVRATSAPDRTQGFCRIENALRLTGGATPLSPAGPVITCPVALGYAAWIRHVVDPAARDLLGSTVVRTDHYGSYACRNIYGRAKGKPSQHAYANALDVAGFRLADGRRLSVAPDFRRDDARGRFLSTVRDGACLWFRGVLSPDYNAAHRDHLHLDFGRFGICR